MKEATCTFGEPITLATLLKQKSHFDEDTFCSTLIQRHFDFLRIEMVLIF